MHVNGSEKRKRVQQGGNSNPASEATHLTQSLSLYTCSVTAMADPSTSSTGSTTPGPTSSSSSDRILERTSLRNPVLGRTSVLLGHGSRGPSGFVFVDALTCSTDSQEVALIVASAASGQLKHCEGPLPVLVQ